MRDFDITASPQEIVDSYVPALREFGYILEPPESWVMKSDGNSRAAAGWMFIKVCHDTQGAIGPQQFAEMAPESEQDEVIQFATAVLTYAAQKNLCPHC